MMHSKGFGPEPIASTQFSMARIDAFQMEVGTTTACSSWNDTVLIEQLPRNTNYGEQKVT